MWTLLLSRQADPPGTFLERRQIESGQIVIGRDATRCDWVLNDTAGHLSRAHCTISAMGLDLFVQDTSTNGVSLNAPGQRIAPQMPVAIRVQDRLLIGDYAIEVATEAAGMAANLQAQALAASAPPTPAFSQPDSWFDAPADVWGMGAPSAEVHEFLGNAMHDFLAPAPSARGSGADNWGGPLSDAFSKPILAASPAPSANAFAIPENWDLSPAAPSPAPVRFGGGAAHDPFGAPPATPASADDPFAAFARTPDGPDPFATPSPAAPKAPAPTPDPFAGFDRPAPFAGDPFADDPFRRDTAPDPFSAPARVPTPDPFADLGAAAAGDPFAGFDPSPPAAASDPFAGYDASARKVTAAPQAAPPPDPVPMRVPTPAAPTSAAAPDAEGWAAFCEGAGMDPADLRTAPDAMRRLGVMYRQVVLGLSDLIQDRAAFKDEFRVERTQLGLGRNNPLKHLPAADSAKLMLGSPLPGFMDAEEAVRAAFEDVKKHQLAMLAGVQHALKAVFDRLSPDEIGRIMAKAAGDRKGLRFGRGVNPWSVYQAVFEALRKDATSNVNSVMSVAFRDGYEAFLSGRG